MSTNAHTEGQEILHLMTAVMQALKSTASTGGGKLKKPEVVAALLKVLRSVVSAEEAQSKQHAAQTFTSSFSSDIEAIQSFVAEHGMA